MKKSLLFIVIVLLVALTSCTNNNKVVTKDGIIELSDHQGINKEDSTGNNSDGGSPANLEEE